MLFLNQVDLAKMNTLFDIIFWPCFRGYTTGRRMESSSKKCKLILDVNEIEQSFYVVVIFKKIDKTVSM